MTSARANQHRTISRLEPAGLIALRHTERDQQFPKRSVYELTDEARQGSRTWLADMLAIPRYGHPESPPPFRS